MKSEAVCRTVVITGANTGIGLATAEALAKGGDHVVMCGRSSERTLPAVQRVNDGVGQRRASFLEVDLANLASVAKAAASLNARSHVDVLINNAGVAGARGVTADGFEMHFGTNHLGHFLLTTLVMPTLLRSSEPRLVMLSSNNHYKADNVELSDVRQPTRSATGLPEYNLSKLCNVMVAKEAARRFGAAGLLSMSVDPGPVASDVWRHIPWPLRRVFMAVKRMKTVEEGAHTSVYCASAPRGTLVNGGYYADSDLRDPNPMALQPELSTKLWDRSEDWVKAFGLSQPPVVERQQVCSRP